MVLTYMVGAAFVLRGYVKSLPLVGAMVFVMFAYLLSLTQILPGTTRDHGLYMIAIVSNFILFYLVYNFIRHQSAWRDVWAILAVLNVLVLIYCIIEMVAGSAGIRFFGMSELEIKSARAETGRLSGPFRAVAMTAEYMGIQSLICVYALMRFSNVRSRIFWFGLLAGNLGFMIATGNRGGVIALAIGLAVLMYLFRRELGFMKIITWLSVGAVAFVMSAFVVVNYTQYNVLFERLQETEFDGALPDTRQGWVRMWDQIIAKPIIGHGPRLRLMDEQNRRIPGYTPITYPHSGYLYLIYTVGVTGLLAYMLFFTALAREYWRARTTGTDDPLLRGLPLLGIAILVLFAVSQARMEMFRYMLHAYQQYLFMLVGAFLAFAHVAMERRTDQKTPDAQRASESPKKLELLSRVNKSSDSEYASRQ